MYDGPIRSAAVFSKKSFKQFGANQLFVRFWLKNDRSLKTAFFYVKKTEFHRGNRPRKMAAGPPDFLLQKNPIVMAKMNKGTFSYGGEKIAIEKSTELAAIKYNKGAAPKTAKAAKGEEGQLESFRLVRAPRGIDSKLDALRKSAKVATGSHVFHLGGTDAPYVPTGKIYVEMAVDADSTAVRTLLESLHLRIISTEKGGIYHLEVTSGSPNPVKVCMALQKEKIVLVAEPEFVTFPQTNDFLMPVGQFFKTQWHHKNTGDAIPIIDIDNAIFGKQHFKKGADARVFDAWQYLQDCGSDKIRVAVIDTGFDIDHPALLGNGSKIRLPFNAGENSTDVSPVYFNSNGEAHVAAHGTSCAAVAVGTIDDQGVFGAAPKCQLTPIKLDILSDTAIIRAFQHALNNNVDVISCSLGFPSPVPLSTQVSNFLKKVSTEGRGGRGIPMFFAAGNANPSTNYQPREISDFAANPSAICIVASNSLDERSDYSFFGKNAWISAPTNGDPGVGITTASADWDGSIVVHNYTSGFGGTSSAAPLAAGTCALMLSAMAGFDERDSTSLQRETEDYARDLAKPLAGLRIGLPKEFFGEGMDADVRAAVEAALDEYRRLGAATVEVSLPNSGLSVAAYYVIAPAEASSNLSRFDGVRYGHRAAEYADLVDMYCKSRAQGFGEEVKRRILIGTYVLSHGYYDAYYIKAQQVRRLIADEFQRAFQSCDLIAGPVTTSVAFDLGEKAVDPVTMYLADLYTIPGSLAGVPGMSVPCGFGDKGRPVGLHLMANYFDEARLLGAAHQFQLATDWHRRVPTGFEP